MRHQLRDIDRTFERSLRRDATDAERALWKALKMSRAFHFRRQHRIARYIVDFYCARVRLAIELDGAVHDDDRVRESDRLRTAALERLGIRVVRFQNEEVLGNVRLACSRIEEICGGLL